MATSTTTAQLIREQQITQIEGLRGAQSRGVSFKSYKRPQDFREWADEASSACLRRFTIEDLGTYEVPTISDGFTEEVSTQFEVVVAYPVDNRYGTDASYGLQDIIRSDHARIQALIGINGYGQYVAGHSLCSLSDFTIEKGERAWFAVSTYDVMFYQTVYTGTLYITASISGTATVTATPEPYTVTASVSASASVTVTSSLMLGGPTQLFNGDFSTPVTSWASGRTNFTSAFATSEWTFESYSSGFPSNTGGGALVNDGTGGLTAQTAPDVYTASGYATKKAWEADSVSARLHCQANTTEGDAGTSDFAGRIVFRLRDFTSSNDYIISKRQSGAGNPGWSIRTASTAAAGLTLTVTDGTTAVDHNIPGNYHDGALHYIAFHIDQAANLVRSKSDLNAETTSDISGVTGNISSNDGLTINQLHGTATAGGILGQICCVSLCDDSNAASHYAESFWQHATDPTGLLTTTTRASLISREVAAGYVAHFADDTLPIGYNSAFNIVSNPNQFGLRTNSATTNLVTYSELSTGATSSNVTATDNAADAPDGFRSATTIQASANNGYLAKTFTTSASTNYCASVYIEESTVGVTGRVILYDESNATEIASQTFTGSSTPQRISCSGATGVGGVSASVRVEVDTSGETVIAWGWQAELGTTPGSYIRTNGSTATLAFGFYVVSGTDGQYAKAQTGELEAVLVINQQSDGNEHWVDISDAGATGDGRVFRQGSDLDFDFLAYDASSGIAVNIASTPRSVATEYTVVCRWDADGGLDVTAGADGELLINGSSVANSVGTFTYTTPEDLTDIRIGSDNSSGSATNGDIQSVKIWDGEGGAT